MSIALSYMFIMHMAEIDAMKQMELDTILTTESTYKNAKIC